MSTEKKRQRERDAAERRERAAQKRVEKLAVSREGEEPSTVRDGAPAAIPEAALPADRGP